MKGIAFILAILLLAGCTGDDLSWISIRNDTTVPIYALPYSSEFTDGGWIQPGGSDDFYSINCDCLDAFDYFSFYYDSLIVFMKDYDDHPIKFYQDGSTVNYDPELNPFTNPDVWKSRELQRHVPGNSFNTLKEKRVFDHYFCIDARSVVSLPDSILLKLNPAF